MAIPKDPLFKLQLHLRNLNTGQFDLNVVDVWDDYTGAGVQVSVIDNGIDLGHADLDDNLRTDIDYDYYSSDFDPSTGAHGTSVAGIIGAEEGNGYGGVGIAWDVDLISFRGFGRTAVLDAAGLGDGIGNTNGNDSGSDIINASYGIIDNFSRDSDSDALPDIADHGRGGLGTIFTHANGNEREGSGGSYGRESLTEELASDQRSISANAVRFDGWVTRYSTPGANSLISAFADNLDNSGGIVTTDITGAAGYNRSNSPTGDFVTGFNGTSSAAPEIAGVVALMLEANDQLGWRDVQTILAYSARHVGSAVGTAANTGAPSGGGFEIATQTNGSTWFWNDARNWNGGALHFSNDYGYGLIDALAAVRLAETWDTQSTSHNQVNYSLDIDGTGPTSVGPTTTTFSAQLAEDIIVEHVSLNLNFSVDNINDMSIFLVSPDGTRVQLINYVDGAGGTQSLDSGEEGWDFGTTAFMGTVNEGGSDPAGTGNWSVEVTNIDGTDAGAFTITDADLTFKGRPIEEDNLYIFTNEFSDYFNDGEHVTTFTGGTANGNFGTINAAAVSSDTTLNFLNDTGTIDGIAVTPQAISEAYTGDGNDTITGDGVTRLIFTGRGNDSIIGGFGSAGELINGGPGDDNIEGGSGDDIIIDGIANDTEGMDTIDGGAGNDLIVANWIDGGSYAGGADIDTLDVRGDSSAFALSHAINLNDASFTAFAATFSGFENVMSGRNNDQITGSAVANVLIAGRGNDTVSGGAGADTILGDDIPFGLLAVNKDGVTDQSAQVTGFAEMPTENFTVEWLYRGTAAQAANYMSFVSYAVPNSTNEFLVFAQATGTISIWLNDGAAFDTGVPTSTVLDGDVHRMSVSVNSGAGPNGRISLYVDGVEVFRGAGSTTSSGTAIAAGGTFLLGQDQDGQIPGGGFDANQRLVGEVGDIRVWNTELDADVIGELAFKRLEALDLRGHPSLVANWQLDADALAFDNIAGTASMTATSAAANPFASAEYSRNGGDDSLDGGSGNDTIRAGGGNDTIVGRDGVDHVYGGSGNDNLVEFSSDNGIGEIFNGGEDSDTYQALQFAVATTNLRDDTITSVETLEFILYGNDLTLQLDAIQLADNFASFKANPGTRGSAIIDIAMAAVTDLDLSGRSFAGFNQPTDVVLITGDADHETITGSSINNRIEGNGGNDELHGGQDNDQLFGGADDDILLGGADGDVLDGGAGLDRAQYSDATAGVLADLQNSAANTGFAAGDTYVSIENLLGSLFSDNLRGDGGANVLWGHDGNDRLYGRGGNDNLQGMNGNDSLYSGDGDDSLYGGDGNDLLDGGAGGDTFEFRIDFGSDRIVGFDDDLDEVRLDDAIWGSDLSAAVLLSTYGSVVSGSSFLDFGGGNTITFVNFANLSELADDFVFI